SCMLYAGTTVVTGQATAVVVATGVRTAAGRSIVEAGEPPSSGVETRLASLTKLTVPVSVASGAAVAGLGLLHRRSLADTTASAVGLTVAAVPEGLPLLANVAQLAAARRLAAHNVLV